MRTVTATAASRGFSELLNDVANGETVMITRNGVAIAEVRPPIRHTLANLLGSLSKAPGFDAAFETDINSALLLLQESPDPWAGV